jgi:excisionase family DNA binding protein
VHAGEHAEPVWLTVDEFADLLRLPRSSVYEAIAGGRLEHRRIGRNIRIHRDAGFVAAETRRRRPQRSPVVIVRNRKAAVSSH